MPEKVIIIGGGPGGYVAAIRAAQLGAETILIESTEIGGTCLNAGCIPTKAFLHAAKLYNNAKNSELYGVKADNVRLDFEQMTGHKDEIIKGLRSGVEHLLRAWGVTVVKARGEFKSKNEILAGEKTYIAPNIIIATGSTPGFPPIDGVSLAGVMSSNELLKLKTAPKSVVIVGGGVIGMEFATFFSMLRIPVTVIEALHGILQGFDRDVVKAVEMKLKENGVKIHTDAKVQFFRNNKGLETQYQLDGRIETINSEIVLLATGRKPLTTGIGLEQAGVHCDATGFIPVDEKMRTNVPGIYAIGDCNGQTMLAHAASAQGVAAVEHALGHPAYYNGNVVPSCVYSSPEIGAVGLTEEQVKESGIPYYTGHFPLAGNGKSFIEGYTDGFVKLIFEKEYDSLIGAHIIGPAATELIAELTIALSMEATVDDIIATIHPHPTVNESIMEAALDAKGRAIHWRSKK